MYKKGDGFVARIKAWAVEHLAAGYVAGPHVEDALRVCRRVGDCGWSSILCPWNGAEDTPREVAASYRHALDSIIQERLDSYLSIKVPALEHDWESLRTLLELAAEHGIRVHFDAQEPDSATRSFALLEKSASTYRNLGCTLPSRWRRSLSDAERVLDLGIPVRVVKGQWPDPAAAGLDPRALFLELIDALAGRAPKVGVATHDTSLARESLIRLQKNGTSCELEQLYGLPIRAVTVAHPLGVGVRVYVAYGHAWLPYALSEIRKRPILLAWILRDLILDPRRGMIGA